MFNLSVLLYLKIPLFPLKINTNECTCKTEIYRKQTCGYQRGGEKNKSEIKD